MLSKLKVLVLSVVASMLFIGCGKGQPIPPELSKSLYTQHNFWQIKGRNYTTNYSKGIMVPVNTEVKITKITRKVIYFTVVASGQKMHIINVVKHTKLDSVAMTKRYFGSSKIDLNKFTKTEKSAILSGRIVNGMSKKSVIISRGYPPESLTPTTDADFWSYQHNKYNMYVPVLIRQNLQFKDGKVISITR